MSTIPLKTYTIFIIVILLQGLSLQINAQVHIAPVAVYLSENNTSGHITVHNSSDQPQELNIELLYGYPDTDEEGNVFLNTFEIIPEGASSAVEFARIYPRHLILPPKEQQTIRFSVRPPSHLKPGEYWARPAVSSTPVKQENKSRAKMITTSFNVTNRTILSLSYRHGRAQTGIDIKDIEAFVDEDGNISLETNLLRHGNAAYLGHAMITVLSDGEEIHRQKQEIAVYNNQLRKFNIGKKLTKGDYTISLTLYTSDREKENNEILPAKKTLSSTILTIQ